MVKQDLLGVKKRWQINYFYSYQEEITILTIFFSTASAEIYRGPFRDATS
jgi:hypothetical protein